jgi:MFS family permease
MKKFFAKDEFKILGGFYLERFVAHLIYFAPAFWIIFFNETLNLTQISILFAILCVSNFIFEIPTGAIGDLWGRKVSTLFAYIMMGLLLPTFIFVTNFYHLMGLFALWGLFRTFHSGSRDAWIIDNLKYYKKSNLINTYYLKEHSFIHFGMFLSGLLGAYIVATLGINAIWIFAGLSWIISLLFLLPVKEHKLTKNETVSFRTLYKQSKTAIRYSLKHQVLLFILLATFFITFRHSFGRDIIWQPFLRDLGLPIYAFGLLFSAYTLLGSIAPIVAKPLLKILKTEKKYFIFLLVLGMILNFGVVFVNTFMIGIIFMLAMIFLLHLFMPINNAFIHAFIPSKTRATIISFKSAIVSLAYAISYPIAGFFADRFGTQSTIMFGGIFLIPAIYFYLKMNPTIKR